MNTRTAVLLLAISICWCLLRESAAQQPLFAFGPPREPQGASYSYSVSITGNRHASDAVSRHDATRFSFPPRWNPIFSGRRTPTIISTAVPKTTTTSVTPVQEAHSADVPDTSAPLPEVPAIDTTVPEDPSADVHSSDTAVSEDSTSGGSVSVGPASDVKDHTSDTRVSEVSGSDVKVSENPVSTVLTSSVPVSKPKYRRVLVRTRPIPRVRPSTHHKVPATAIPNVPYHEGIITDISAFEALIPSIPDTDPIVPYSPPYQPVRRRTTTRAPAPGISYQRNDEPEQQQPIHINLVALKEEEEESDQSAATPVPEVFSPEQYRLAQYSFKTSLGR